MIQGMFAKGILLSHGEASAPLHGPAIAVAPACHAGCDAVATPPFTREGSQVQSLPSGWRNESRRTGAGIHRVDIMIQLGHPDAAVHGLTRKGWEWINANFKTRPFPVPRIPQEFAPELVKRIEDEGLTVKF